MVECIFNSLNPGITALYIAMRISIKNRAKYHLILNPDVYFEREVLEELFTYIENNPDVGLVILKILYPNGEIQYLYKLLSIPFDLILKSD
jgi:GT2 family glycosyltransferase